MEKIRTIHKKLRDLQEINDGYLKELKTVAKEVQKKHIQIVSFFTYSVNLNHQPDGENLIIGSYHITNLGLKSLHHPYICIKLNAEDQFDFSGKYFYEQTQQKMKLANAWLRFNEASNQQEFWLKPSKQHILYPQETLTFQNFQLKWMPNMSYSGSVIGFTYGDEIEKGVHALNQISVSGKVEEGKGHE